MTTSVPAAGSYSSVTSVRVLTTAIKTMLHSIVFQTLLLSLLSSCTEAWKPVVITSEALLRHQTKRFHPECPDRLANTLTTMREMEQDGLISIREPVDPNFDSLRVIKMVHDHDYVAEVEDMCNKGAPFISPWDTDTYINRDSFETVVTAQAAWINAVDDAMTNKRMNFALTRPPGHHASKTQSMGFCIFNFAAGAAFYAIEKYNLERVGILDFDVHFGNGVADLISPNPKIR